MIGTTIGRYRIDAELGRGGMGVVYRATQLTLDRTVAIKMLPRHQAASEEYLARFRREAETLARLAHEDIVHIYDIEEHEGDHFIIMEFVSGPTLTRRMAEHGRLDPARARDVATIVANALAVAHRQGIVHRDLKPDNILFSAAGRPKLTDFGIAHMRDDSKYKTRTGIMLGTPYYLSPEQALGRPVTPASDLYSLGVVLYEMLCGAVPFDGRDALSVALKHVQEEPAPLSVRAPELPEDLCALVHRAMAKEPGDRFPDARELHRRLIEIDLGTPPGMALHLDVPRRAGEVRRDHDCPECGTGLRSGFVRCPACGAAVRKTCPRCGNRYDPVAPQCPACRTPAPPAAAPPIARPPGRRAWPAAPSPAAAGLADRVEGAARAGAGLVAEGAQVAGEALSGWVVSAREAAPTRTVVGRAIEASRRRAARLPLAVWAGMGLVVVGVGLAVAIGAAGDGEEPPAGIVRRMPLAPGEEAAGPPPAASTAPASAPTSVAAVGPAIIGEGTRIALSPGDQTVRAVMGGEDPPPVFLRVSSPGAWRVEDDARWIAIAPAAGRGDARLEIRIEIAGMTAGSYRATVTVRAADGSLRRQAAVRLVLTLPEGTGSGPRPSAGEASEEGPSASGTEEQARAEIGDLLARYESASEGGDFDRLRPYVTEEVARKWRDGFASLHRQASDVSLRLSGVEIDVRSEDRARVSFDARIEGRVDGKTRRFFDGGIRWDVRRIGGRWTIVSTSQ